MKEFWMKQLAQKSKDASKKLMKLSHEVRRQVLNELADNLLKNKEKIIAANTLDMEAAEASGLNVAMKDRLKLDDRTIESMAQGVRDVSDQKEVVGVFQEEF